MAGIRRYWESVSKQGINRRRFLNRGVLLTAGVGAFLVGCGSNDDKSKGSGVQKAPLTRGGALTVAVTNEIVTFDPVKATSPTGTRQYYYLLFDPLLAFADGDIKANLASYTITGNKLRLKARDKVSFHDGTPLNGAAMKAHIDRIMNPETASREATNLKSVQSVTLVDEMTIELTMKDASIPAVLLPSLAGQGGMISSPAAIAKFGKDYTFNPVGTGPFIFESHAVNDRTAFKKNPSYWKNGEDGSPLPYLDRMVVRFIPDAGVGLTELRSGGVSILPNLTDPKSIQLLKGERSLSIVETPQTNAYWVGMNRGVPALADIRVRQAIEYAIDREAINKGLFEGLGKITPTFMGPAEWAYDASVKSYSFDPAKSKQLLEAAGATNVSLEMLTTDRSTEVAVSQAVQGMLSKANINVKLDPEPTTQWVTKSRSCTQQMNLSIIIQPVYEPYARIAPLYGPGGSNWTCYSNSAIDAPLEKAFNSTDRNERKRLYNQVQNIVAEDAVYAWLPNVPVFAGVSNASGGLVFDPEGGVDMSGMWIKS